MVRLELLSGGSTFARWRISRTISTISSPETSLSTPATSSGERRERSGLGNPVEGHSDPVVLARLLIGYDRYWPAVQDYENPFTPTRLQALKASEIPVIAFSSTNIATDWPAWVYESARSTGTSNPAFTKFPGWGHLEVLCGNAAEAQVFAPTLEWLRRHAK